MATTAGNKRSRSKASTPAPAATPPSTKPTKTQLMLQALITGLEANGATLGPIILPSGEISPADLITVLQQAVAAIQAAQAAKVVWQNAVAAQDAATAKIQPQIDELKQALRARFGAASITLQQFGITPTIRREATAAEKAARAAKASATRAAKKAAAPKATAPAVAAHTVTTGTA